MRKALVFIFLIPLIVNAQTPLSFQELGLSFELPAGWSGQVQGDYYVAGHNEIPGLLILFQNNAQNAEALKRLAMQGIYDQTVQLQPTSEFQLNGENKIEGFYTGIFDGSQVKCFATGLINSRGSGLNIIIITSPESFKNQHVTEVKKLASSVEFFVGTDSELTKRWKNKLIGQQLKYMHTSSSTDYSGGYSGTSQERSIKLFNNSKFEYYSNSNASFSTGNAPGGFGYMDNTDSNNGDYKIYSVGNTTYLVLNFSNGKIYEYSITADSDGATYLNGDRYFVVSFNE